MRNYAVLEIAKRAAALEAENERLRGIVPEVLERLNDELCAENESLHELNEKLADLLRRTMLAIRGPEPELTHWDWSDLPERAEAALAAQAVPQQPAPAIQEPITWDEFKLTTLETFPGECTAEDFDAVLRCDRDVLMRSARMVERFHSITGAKT